ncbi:MAG: UDP-N-acetylmuramate--L-alanine ligase [Acidimicrobiaceae bacterium]|nr:UDP-N-acetylmuramate--L-alanine ligase [Acidimicrobiaceae bacterium]MYH78266.1 UDP-N-acetylmuramate--L-alanine ligase [Acidimicrobiaceae bacterium]MYK76223.1 UDP-N-acetylmuramate--L-alanine ligase [Acidimicrobiaceae bacterium]
MSAVDLSVPTSIHVIGAGGAGMGAIASVLRSMGHQVTGSDLRDGPVVARLRAEGVPVSIGHDPANIGDAAVVAISSAIRDSNPEVRAALERGVPVVRRGEILPAIASSRRTIAVAGTHGKTTTSSMLALALVEAGLGPSFIIGGDVNEIGTGAMWDSGEWFVVEADESDNTFLSLDPEVAVVTSVESDHLENYQNSPAALAEAFEQFLASSRHRIVCADDVGAARLGAAVGATTYGTHPGADFRMVDVSLKMPSCEFELWSEETRLGLVTLPTPGLHNALNATAAIVAALTAGSSFADAARALARFGGVARRFEFRGDAAGVTFVDDYAHLPSEVAAALAAARTGDWRRVVCVFQPHRYSRVASIGSDFAHSFVGADHLVLTGIYPSGEAPRPGVTSKIVLDAVLDAHPWSSVTWLPRLDEVADWLEARLRPGDLCLTLGAGDLTSTPDVVIERLEAAGALEGVGG